MNEDHRNDRSREALDGADRSVLAGLRAALEAADPVPEHVVAAAKAAPGIVGLDDEYLHLVASATGATAGVRGAGERLVVFRSPGWNVEVSVLAAGDRRTLDGQVNGGAVEVVHERVDGTQRGEVDRFGQFLLARVPAGLGRLVLVAEDGRRVPSAWVVW